MSDASVRTSTTKLIYFLYLAGIIPGFGFITITIGLVMAYVNKDDAPQWLQSHYQFQIRTFWMSLVFILFGIPLSVVFIGWFILIFWALWLIIRCAKGIKYLDAQQAHPNPTGWLLS